MKTEGKDGNSLRQRVIENMEEKETDELLRIWKKNNRNAWSDLAFEVIHDILWKRLGIVPEQNAPLTNGGLETDEMQEDEMDEDNEEEQDTFHDPNLVLDIASLARNVAWVVLVLGIALIFSRVLLMSGLLSRSSASQGEPWIVLLADAFVYAIALGVSFIILLSISQGLYLFLDIERNTYLATKKRK